MSIWPINGSKLSKLKRKDAKKKIKEKRQILFDVSRRKSFVGR